MRKFTVVSKQDAAPEGPHHNHHPQPSSSNDSVATGISSTNPRHIKQIHNKMERDGFCRRVDYYDGQTIHVDGITTYEVGNYLGGGVAGVVHERQRLHLLSEYPVRLSYQEMLGLEDDNPNGNASASGRASNKESSNSIIGQRRNNSLLSEGSRNNNNYRNGSGLGENHSQVGCAGIFCGPSHSDLGDITTTTATHDLKLEAENLFLAGLPPPQHSSKS